jgi:hypothetical protein
MVIRIIIKDRVSGLDVVRDFDTLADSTQDWNPAIKDMIAVLRDNQKKDNSLPF